MKWAGMLINNVYIAKYKQTNKQPQPFCATQYVYLYEWYFTFDKLYIISKLDNNTLLKSLSCVFSCEKEKLDFNSI